MPSLEANSPFRKRFLAKVNARYAAFLAPGFPVPEFGEGETLQISREVDRTNWLGMHSMCLEAISAGFGEAPVPLGFRCTSNRSFVVTFNEALSILQGLRTWAALAQANWWRLKDAVRSAETLDELNALDLDEGWP